MLARRVRTKRHWGGNGVTTGRNAILAVVVATTALLVVLPGTQRAEQARASEQPRTAQPEGRIPAKHALYERKGSLQETLLEIRQRYRAWLVEQPAARKAVEFGLWRTTPPLPLADAARDVRPAEGIDPHARQKDGKALWSEKKNLADGKVVKFLSGSGDTAVYLTRTVRAKRPVRLTVGIGGGKRLDLWLNRQEITSADTHLTSGRYGCANRVDGTRVDQVLVNLDLRAGENVLVLRLTPDDVPSFYFSASPNPVPRFWEQARRDFPATQNPLLDLVHATWFDNDGWFTAQDSKLEKQLIERLLVNCGDDGARVRADFDGLNQAKTDPNDRRWLDLCVKCSVFAKLRGDLDRLTSAVNELGRTNADEYPADELLGRLSEYRQRLTKQAGERLDPADEATRRLMAEMPKMQRRMLVDLNPLLRNAEITFVKRYTYNSKHYYDDFQHITRWGGNLFALRVADGRLREIAPQLAGGLFDRYDLSFDGKRIVFGYRRPKPEGFRIYEIGADGSGLRQVTRPPADEEQRIAKYGQTSRGDSFYGSMGYHFWTDDVHPCYLPGGDICFASTRSEHGVLCTPAHYLACTNLFRMNAKGRDMQPLSHGSLSEFTPTVMEDGRLLYNRWEYVYKGIGAVQPLWTTRPDGSGSEEFYGNNIANPGVFWQARQVPGHPHLAVCIGCGHEPLGVGQVLLLDQSKDRRTSNPMLNLTPNVKVQNLRGLFQLRNGVWREDLYGPFYSDPYPLSDKFFLVSCNPDKRYNDQTAYGIYLLDAFGNRVPIYDDPNISAWQPMLLRSRKQPPVLARRHAESLQHDATATLFLSDVYRGLSGVKPGAVKYIRVMEQIPKPWAAEVDPVRGGDRTSDGHGGHIAIGLDSHIWVAVLLGVTPVEDDGSACFKVPANRNLFFQALDEDYMEVQRMRTFVNLKPGETRSCVGCHEPRDQAPVPRLAKALSRPPAKLSAQPGDVAPRPLHYPTNVQPILDRHCISCHNGKDPKAIPDLRGELTTMFNRSYENILQGGLVDTVREWHGITYAMQNAEAVPPYSHGSHRSRFITVLRAGHHDVKLSKEEWIKLVTWIDSGVPYYGSYYGRRHLKYRGQPDFRPRPSLSSARGVPPPGR